MDGLMIDSEPFHQKAFDEALKEVGSSLSVEENNERYVGITDLDAAFDMIERKHLHVKPIDLVTRKQHFYKRYLQTHITANDGLLELLHFLKHSDIKVAIASSSTLEEISSVIDRLEIRDYIDFYCSGTQVPKGKPAPDVFLFAASNLGTDPTECVVLEDAPSGLRAGKAANMHVIVVPSRETKGKDFTEADAIFTSLKEVPEYIKQRF